MLLKQSKSQRVRGADGTFKLAVIKISSYVSSSSYNPSTPLVVGPALRPSPVVD